MLKNGLFKILFASIIIFTFVNYVSADMFGYGAAGQRIGVNIVYSSNDNVDPVNNFTYEHGWTAWFGLHYQSDVAEGKAGFEVGGFTDFWGKLNIMDNMSVLVGRTNAVFLLNRNGAVFNDAAENICNPWVGRFDMIQFKAGGFTIAAMNAKDKFENLQNITSSGMLADIDGAKTINMFPRIEAIYSQTIDNMFYMAVGGGIQIYKFEYGMDSDINVNSHILGLELQGMFGPVTITGRGTYGSNLGLYLPGVGGYNDRKPVFDLEADEILNNTSVSGFAGVKIKIVDAIAPGLGFGYTYQKHDVDAHSSSDEAMYLFTNCEFVIMNHLTMYPEIGYLNEMKDHVGNEQNSTVVLHSIVRVTF